MANAIRSRTVQKGIDPRDYALVAFGGAGPLHGAEVADDAGHPRGDRAAASRASPRPSGLLTTRPALRRDPHRVPGLRARSTSRASTPTSRAMAGELRRALHRRRHRPRGRHLRARAAICATSARATSCTCRSPTAPIDDKVLAKVLRDLPRARIAREYGHALRATPASRSSTCAWSAPASAAKIAKPAVGTAKSLDAARVRQGTVHVPRRRQARRLSRPPSIAATCCRSASASPAPPSSCRWTRRPSCRRGTHLRGRRRRAT